MTAPLLLYLTDENPTDGMPPMAAYVKAPRTKFNNSTLLKSFTDSSGCGVQQIMGAWPFYADNAGFAPGDIDWSFDVGFILNGGSNQAVMQIQARSSYPAPNGSILQTYTIADHLDSVGLHQGTFQGLNSWPSGADIAAIALIITQNQPALHGGCKSVVVSININFINTWVRFNNWSGGPRRVLGVVPARIGDVGRPRSLGSLVLPSRGPAGPGALFINFTTVSGEQFPGYRNVHGGIAYPASGYGTDGSFRLGWTSVPADRNRQLIPPAPDERYDSFSFQGSPAIQFKIDVPCNGPWALRIVSGDPQFAQGPLTISANGVPYFTNANTNAAQWLDLTQTIQVTNGQIVVSVGGAAGNSCINFIDLVYQGPQRWIGEKGRLSAPAFDVGNPSDLGDKGGVS